MRCPQCQQENSATAMFCEACGTRMIRTCPDCGHEARLSAKFCEECGRALTGQPSTPPPQPVSLATEPERDPLSYTPPYLAEKILTSRSALEGERKQVTVLFADIKDSTELITDLDPEEAQQLLDPAIHIMMDAVHRFEGTVNQVLGDGIMALFGAPIAHEDHALRASYAALAMQAAMREHTEDIRRTHGIEMHIRVGLNSGEVVVRAIGNDLHMDYSAVGPTTHLAARMEQLATPGSIRLSSSTIRLVEGLVWVNDLGPVPVKGLSEPVDVYELTGASTVKRRFQAAVARGLTTFVGRETEVAVLKQALEQAGKGHGQIVAAVGEAGVGKSRLVYEFVHSHRTQSWQVLESASVSYGKATPYFPVIDLLKRYVHAEDGDDTRTIRAKVTGQIVTLDESLQGTIPPLLSLLGALPEDSPFPHLDPPQRRQRTLDGLKRILLRESQVQPLLLVFEDLHWIDSETQALLDSLIESLPTAQMLLLVNYRPEYQHSWGSKTYYTQLRLDPLPPESADEFLEVLLGTDASLAPLKKLLIARTEGNPFFLEESVRTLVETEKLVGKPGAYRLVHDLPTIQVPPTVQAVLAARIDRLPQDEKRLLQTAAVIGIEVPFALLQAIAELSEEALYRGLSHLQATEFLDETRLFPEREYTFQHALTQNVAYQSLLTSTKQRVHQQIAQAFETRFSETATLQPELLAHHYTEAGCHEQAVDYWYLAGQKALERSANIEAMGHLTKGLELLERLPDTLANTQQELLLHMTLGPALMAIKGYAAPEVEHAYARAQELCQQIGDVPRLGRVLNGLSLFYFVRGEVQTSREVGEQLLQLAQRQYAPLLLQRAHLRLGQALFYLGAVKSAHIHIQQGVALFRSEQDRPYALRGADLQVGYYAHASLALWWLGYPEQACEQSGKALTLARDLLHPHSLAWALNYTALLHHCRQEWDVVQERAEEATILSLEQGLQFWASCGMILHGWALTRQKQYEVGIEKMHHGLDAWHVTGAALQLTNWWALLAETYGDIGRVEEGLSLLVKALSLGGKTGEHFYEAEIHRLKGQLLLQQASDNQTEAESCFHQAISIAQNQSAKSWELRAATSLARLWQAQGKRQAAFELLAPVYGWFTEGFDTADLQDAKTLLGKLKA
jgi:class 3 adenylate cyclase/predicted ATPase